MGVADSPTAPRRPSSPAQEHRPTSSDFSISSEPASPTSIPSSIIPDQPTTGLHVPKPQRPNLETVNSSSALLGSYSNGNTPTAENVEDPFRSSTSLAVSPGPSSPESPMVTVSAADGSAAPFDTTAPPPKIQVNSIPNTPEQPSTATFNARPSFAAPFASSHDMPSPTTLTHRRVSLATSTQSYGATENDPKRTSGSGIKSAIMQRRSQRAQQGRPKPKERDSKDAKGMGNQLKRKPFESTRLKGEIYKPWLEKKDPAQRWARWITISSIIIGIGLCAFLCYDGYRSVPNLGKICSVLDDDFNTLDTNTWQREVRLDGYGTGSFQWTTASDNNSFVDNGILYLVPTLTSDHLGEEAISNGYTLNLTTDGTCTSTNVSQCVAVSNSSKLTVINPVMSARLITKNTVTLKYGKVEVRAKFPTGDWLWPSITMLPVNETYGAWPRSGQIDILTGRGNNNTYPNRGVDYAQSDLHWGPTTDLDRLYMTWGYREQRRTYYNQKWHTYGLEWNEDYLWTYIDSKVSQVISLRFGKESFWSKGRFPGTITNSTTGDVIKLTNPWINSAENVAPFDQPFYLVLNLAVGSIDGWFPDGEGGKPWLDNSGTAMSDFWNAKDRWWNAWSKDPKERGFAIDSVKMWKTC